MYGKITKSHIFKSMPFLNSALFSGCKDVCRTSNDRRISTVSVKKKAHISRFCAKKANSKLSFSQRNSEKKKKFLGVSRRNSSAFRGENGHNDLGIKNLIPAFRGETAL